jgi:hypothetical protein
MEQVLISLVLRTSTRGRYSGEGKCPTIVDLREVIITSKEGCLAKDETSAEGYN